MRVNTLIMKTVTSLLALFAMLFVLTACNVQPAGTSTDEHAAENRQYMALLNQKTADLVDILTQFQTAVATSDTVGMRAAASDAAKIVESVSSTEATESLAEVKDAYVVGLTDINTSMNEYADLYAQVAAGTINQAEYDKRVKSVQVSYDQAVERLLAADELLTQLANE